MSTDAQYDRYLDRYGSGDRRCMECGDKLDEWAEGDYCDWCTGDDEDEDDCE